MPVPKVQALLKLPKIEQKSEEWYEIRRNMITASDFAQALGEGKFGTQKQLIEKKCLPRENETEISKTNPFFKWGHMFEPVATSIYMKMFKVVVHEFGLIKHPKHDFFGASPDGITDEGIMLEIKCPMKRKITGEIPTQYYYQIQGQLDVCGLKECDYFECTFELVDYDKWISISDKIKGVFREAPDNKYDYQEPFLKGETCDNVWQGDDCKYWILQEYHIERVTKDAKFVKAKLAELKKVWDKILYYRNNRSAFEIDILSTIEIQTEKFSQGPTALWNTNQYLFRD